MKHNKTHQPERFLICVIILLYDKYQDFVHTPIELCIQCGSITALTLLCNEK